MRRNIITVPIRKVASAVSEDLLAQDLLAVEEPLEIRLGDRNVAITMRTPGNDEELAAGFLFSEGILQDRGQISGIAGSDANVVRVALAEGTSVDLGRLDRHFYISSSCGVCG